MSCGTISAMRTISRPGAINTRPTLSQRREKGKMKSRPFNFKIRFDFWNFPKLIGCSKKEKFYGMGYSGYHHFFAIIFIALFYKTID